MSSGTARRRAVIAGVGRDILRRMAEFAPIPYDAARQQIEGGAASFLAGLPSELVAASLPVVEFKRGEIGVLIAAQALAPADFFALLELVAPYFRGLGELRKAYRGASFTADLFTAFVCALIGLSLNEAAYLAEIVRAGLGSVDPGQTEAAKALGRRPRRTGPATLDELEHYRKFAAWLVIEFGEGCLPIFKRLDVECARARDSDDVLKRVREIAGGQAADSLRLRGA